MPPACGTTRTAGRGSSTRSGTTTCTTPLHVLLTGETDGYYADFADAPARAAARGRWPKASSIRASRRAIAAAGRAASPARDLPPLAFVDFLQNHDQIGNRALGERLTAGSPTPKLLQACQAILLLARTCRCCSWARNGRAAARSFTSADFQGELAEAVREGRRREFAAFFDAAPTTSRIP